MRFLLITTICLFSSTSATAHHPETFNYIKKPAVNVPAAAYRSGYCCMRYDIPANGIPKNVRASYCTDEVFRQSSLQAVSERVYALERKDGSPVAEKNLTATIAYRIQDYLNIPIAGPNSFMTPLPNGEYYTEYICSPLMS